MSIEHGELSMEKKITVFIPYNGFDHTTTTIRNLKSSELVDTVYILSQENAEIDNAKTLQIDTLFSADSLKKINEHTNTGYALFLLQDTLLEPGQFALERFVQVAENTGAGLLYSDYFAKKGDARTPSPVIDYQTGSVRDDFNFGPVVFLRKNALDKAVLLFRKNLRTPAGTMSGLQFRETIRLHAFLNFSIPR